MLKYVTYLSTSQVGSRLRIVRKNSILTGTLGIAAIFLSFAMPSKSQAIATRQGANSGADAAHTPATGSPERKAIMDALRADQKANFEGKNIVFKVHYLKVHNGWAWLDVTPLDEKGKALAEGGPNLLHMENGNWTVKDLSKVAEDPADPMGAEDASPGFIRNLRKVYPEVPLDIFPKPRK